MINQFLFNLHNSHIYVFIRRGVKFEWNNIDYIPTLTPTEAHTFMVEIYTFQQFLVLCEKHIPYCILCYIGTPECGCLLTE